LLPVPVFRKLFRRLMLEKLLAAHKAGELQFFGKQAPLAEYKAFAADLVPLRKIKWYVYTKPPFGGPQAVLAYLARYTHRVAISNSRLIAAEETGVTFRYKDYRINGPGRSKTMTLTTSEFIRRFLSHVLPKGFHRIRHYGLLAGANKTETIARAREFIAAATPTPQPDHAAATDSTTTDNNPCPCCGGRMRIIETFAAGRRPRHQPTAAAIRIDTS
jgi:hypothetical protein